MACAQYALYALYMDRTDAGHHEPPEPEPAELIDLMRDYGELWQIERQASPAAWVAVRRFQPPVFEVYCAVTLGELREKLAHASGRPR